MGSLPPGFENYNDVLSDIEHRFTVKSLKNICMAVNAHHSGTKGLLQQRLRSALHQMVSRGDSLKFSLAKESAELERGYPYAQTRQMQTSRPNGVHSAAPTSTTSQNQWGMSSIYQNVRNPVYKRMPFYNILTYVTQSYHVPACPTSRTTQPIQLRLTSEMLAKLHPKQPSNPYRLVLFCTQTDRIHFGNCVLEFPQHTEIRFNGSIVPANVRGIKNKPGTINPPDLTANAILIQGVLNKIDVTFAESKSSYTLTVYLVEKLTVSQLVEKIRKKGYISKDSTLNKMRAAAQDADIVPGPETLTLKDPISMTRIDLPCKSRYCAHTACFDAATFLTLNEQTPTWICPICNRAITTEDDLFLDGYFNDILLNTNKAVESVIIHPDGSWTNKDIDSDHPDAKFLTNTPNQQTVRRETPIDRKLSFGPPKAEVVSLDDDDEETGAPTPASLPPQTSRLPSTSVRASPAVTPSRKRGPPQIVDLTLSEDEDDITPARSEPPPGPSPAKRLRIDPPSQVTNRIINESLNSRANPLMNGVSPNSTSTRENHIRSPPSSISPRNESVNVFRYNTQAPTTLEPTQLLLRPNNDYSTYSTTTPTLLNSPLPVNRSVTSPLGSRAQLPSPTLNRQYPTSFTPPNPHTDDVAQRDRSVSPVLPAFSPPKQRSTTNNMGNNFMRFDWDAFQNPVLPSSRTWDEEQDELENEELDLEMARLPSSMFDADTFQDSDGY